MNLERAKEIADELGFYVSVKELEPNPYIPNPWGGEFQDKIEYEFRINEDCADLVFFKGGRAFRFEDFTKFRKLYVLNDGDSNDKAT